MNNYEIMSIEASPGKESVFVLAQSTPDRLTLYSRSEIVQRTMLEAFLTGAMPVVEVEDHTTTIKRVEAFAPGSRMRRHPYPVKYIVRRIATQRNPNTGEDHLEAFLSLANSQDQKAFNVTDPFLIQLLVAAFEHGDQHPPDFPLDVTIEGDEITGVHIGEPDSSLPSSSQKGAQQSLQQ